MKLMHSIVHRYCPPSLFNIFQINEEREVHHDLRNANDFTIPFPRIDLFKKSLLFTLPTEWNELDVIKFYQNKTTFAIALKDDLLSSLAVTQ